MEPLRITATLENEVSFQHPIHFCSLLQSRVAMRDRKLAPICKDECDDIPIPVQLSACGRYHLATVGHCDVSAYSLEYVHRFFPVHYAVRRTNMKRVDLSAGTSKIFRIPVEKKLLAGCRMHWWCIGNREPIEELLALTLHLGRGRGRGAGKVNFWHGRWKVEPCEPWHGFPVLSADGAAMRNLPLDTPGLRTFDVATSRLTGPFWAHWDVERVATPVAS